MPAPGALNHDELVALAKQALGGRNSGLMTDAWYSDRVNSAYATLCTFQGPVMAPGMKTPQMRVLRFHELYSNDDTTISTGLSSNFIAPSATRVVSVESVYDLTNDKPLRRKSLKWMDSRDPASTGTPHSFCPGGSGGAVGYYVWPIPGTAGEVISIRERTYRYPDAIASTTEPVIPAVWHKAIWLMAAAEAAGIIDWPEREQELMTRANEFIATRRSPVEEAGGAGGRRYFTIGN